jgi:hypothetical protein
MQCDAAALPLKHQDGVGGSGQAVAARNRIEDVVGVHLARVVHKDDWDAALMRETAQRADRVVPFARGRQPTADSRNEARQPLDPFGGQLVNLFVGIERDNAQPKSRRIVARFLALAIAHADRLATRRLDLDFREQRPGCLDIDGPHIDERRVIDISAQNRSIVGKIRPWGDANAATPNPRRVRIFAAALRGEAPTRLFFLPSRTYRKLAGCR